MTEAEWFASQDVLRMLRWLGERPGARKLRLFGCACLRSLGDALPWEALECLKYVEKAGDGLLRWPEAVSRVTTRTSNPHLPLRAWLPACLMTSSPVTAAADAAYLAGAILANGMDRMEEWSGNSYDWGYQPPASLLVYRAHLMATGPLAPLFRDVVGNPFRPVSFNRDWRTGTAVQLARRMYESREFTLMPILADALQDAGCEDADILGHCRDPQQAHVRGCWVVDLVLGKGESGR
jgi:hypothetical protein